MPFRAARRSTSTAAPPEIGATTQTISGLAVASGVTGSINGSGGTLNVSGGSVAIGYNAARCDSTLNISGAAVNFSSSSPLYIGYYYGGPSNGPGYGQLTLGTGTLNATSITLAQSQYDGRTTHV